VFVAQIHIESGLSRLSIAGLLPSVDQGRELRY
jgi:hypothetical protein